MESQKKYTEPFLCGHHWTIRTTRITAMSSMQQVVSLTSLQQSTTVCTCSVWHHTPIKELCRLQLLSNIRVSGLYSKRLTGYLLSRIQCVVLDGVPSPPSKVCSGAPQHTPELLMHVHWTTSVLSFWLCDCLPYGGKLSREKTFVNFEILGLSMKDFSTKIDSHTHTLVVAPNNPRKFSPRISYFHQFAKVFSLKSFPLYSILHMSVNMLASAGRYSNFSISIFVRQDITVFNIITILLISTERGWSKYAKDALSKHYPSPCKY